VHRDPVVAHRKRDLQAHIGTGDAIIVTVTHPNTPTDRLALTPPTGAIGVHSTAVAVNSASHRRLARRHQVVVDGPESTHLPYHAIAIVQTRHIIQRGDALSRVHIAHFPKAAVFILTAPHRYAHVLHEIARLTPAATGVVVATRYAVPGIAPLRHLAVAVHFALGRRNVLARIWRQVRTLIGRRILRPIHRVRACVVTRVFLGHVLACIGVARTIIDKI
jgi:hypothetical protein